MIPYRIIRSSRKTVAIHITAEGEVLLRCPLRFSRARAEAFLAEKQSWVEKQISRLPPALPPLTARELKELTARAKEDFPPRVERFAGQLGLSYGRITVRSQRTRWGSCSARGSLSFNCLLLLCPEAVRDYVVVHELCHLRQMNHSPRFWAEVAACLPDYEECKKYLKYEGAALIRRLPKGDKHEPVS